MSGSNKAVEDAVRILMKAIDNALHLNEKLKELIVGGARQDPYRPSMYLQYFVQVNPNADEMKDVLETWECVVKACGSLLETRTYFTLYYREEEYDNITS